MYFWSGSAGSELVAMKTQAPTYILEYIPYKLCLDKQPLPSNKVFKELRFSDLKDVAKSNSWDETSYLESFILVWSPCGNTFPLNATSSVAKI